MRVSEIGILDLSVNHPLPLAKVRIPCGTGFPSPADDYLEERLDLNKHLIKHPAATYYARAEGDSMIGAGIYPGDILIVDKAIDEIRDRVIVAWLNGEFTVKRYYIDTRLGRNRTYKDPCEDSKQARQEKQYVSGGTGLNESSEDR